MISSVGFRLLFTSLFITVQGQVLNCIKFEKLYQNFPPLYNFDDYDSCLSNKNLQSNGSTYCMIYAEIQPNNSSALWQKIREHSKEHKFNYRHDHLFFGLCMERCKGFPNSPTSSLTKDDVVNNEITKHYAKIHRRSLDLFMRRNYQNSVYNCLNNEFQEKYDLGFRTFIEYCERHDETKEKDPIETIFYKTLQIIVILNILSTLYDYCLKVKQPEEDQSNEYYRIHSQQGVSRLLTSFSICRNYYRLIQPYHSETAKDFRFLDGFRSVCMLICVSGHMFFIQYQHVKNPEFFENVAKSGKMFWALNATQIIEIFFVMSGLLLALKFEEFHVRPETQITKCLKIYMKGLIFRFSRFFPSLALFLLFNSTIYPHLQDGPFWRHVTEANWIFIRKKWWKNLFLLNNISPKESAYFHTWYLAADWQLFAFYFLILIIMAKYPKYKTFILSTLALLTFVIPFSISYIRKLEPSFMIKPEIYRYTFFKDSDVYSAIYTPFYTNLGGYLFGIISAKLYMKYTRIAEIRKLLCGVLKFELVMWLVLLVALLICWLGCVLTLQQPSLWSALYAACHRNAWIVIVCGLPLLLMTCKPAWIAYEFCCLTIFRILGRLSFQIYLWHFSILYLVTAYQRLPIYVNYLYITTQFILVFSLSIILAFVIVILVEYPLAQSLQVLQSKKESKANVIFK